MIKDKAKSRIERCAFCNKQYSESDYAAISRQIMKHRPACSYECNKKLGQAR